VKVLVPLLQFSIFTAEAGTLLDIVDENPICPRLKIYDKDFNHDD